MSCFQGCLRVFSFASLLFLTFSTTWAVPPTISIQGALTDADGQALTGVRVWRVQFYNASAGGGTLGSALTGTFLIGAPGRFAIELTPPAEVLAASGEVWYELAVDSAASPDAAINPGDIFPNRVAVHSVLFAQRAAQALEADTAHVALQADRATTATNAQNADTATTASVALNALAVGGVAAADLATDSELTNGLAAKANLSHSHRLDTLGGAVTDDQVPDTITIKKAGTANSATVAYQLQGEAFLMVRTTANPATNASNLASTYAAAKALTPHAAPLSTTNRAVVIVPPAQYNLGRTSLALDAEFVDIEGLSNDRDKQHLYGTANGANTGVVRQTANDVRIENLFVECTASSGTLAKDNTDPAAYFPNTALAATVVRNCRFLADDVHAWSMRVGVVEYKGTYEKCTGGKYAFGGCGGTASGTFNNCTGDYAAFGKTASGTFTDCTGGDYAFGDHGTASGTFNHCTGALNAFGGYGGTASGTFTHCTGGNSSFGGNSGGTASGTFTDCTGGHYTFGGYGGTASGTFNNCTGGATSFGGGGTASGTFNNCTGSGPSFGGYGGTASGIFNNCTSDDNYAFGGNGGTASGTFTDCTGGHYAFGSEGTASGTFNNCTGGYGAFGGNGGTAPGGKFYYCSGGSVSFTTDAGTGTAPVHRYCLRNGAVYP